jgi:uncharacterized membrane protein YhaH (DUF805 family)
MGRTFTLEGRLSREEYWREGTALQLGAGFVAMPLLVAMLYGALALGVDPSLVLVLTSVAFAGLMALSVAGSFALSVRRMHDLGGSGWWVGLSNAAGYAGIAIVFGSFALKLPAAIPLGVVGYAAGALVSTRLAWARGQPFANRFGEPPSIVQQPTHPIPEWTRPRDLQAELNLARAELDRAKRALRR